MVEVIIIAMILTALTTGAITVAIVLPLALWVLTVVGRWKLFEKAGIAGWKSIIPFYNTYLAYQIAGMNGWLCLPILLTSALGGSQNGDERTAMMNLIIMVIGLAALVLEIMRSNGTAKNFGKGIGYTIGLIIFEPIFEMILGFGGAQYTGKKVK